MNVLDLFSGIGGFSLGLERAGMRTVAFCEIDPYCRAVLRKHWPDVPVFGDVRELTADTLGIAKSNGCGTGWPRRPDPASAGQQQPQRPLQVDVICGGFPCQDISVAGKGAGIEGSRSGLWSEYARIIGEVRPRYVIMENVAALLGRGLERVLGDLAALGFDAEWHCIPASAVGAPHRRDRVWIVANPGERRCGAEVWRQIQQSWRAQVICAGQNIEDYLADAASERRDAERAEQAEYEDRARSFGEPPRSDWWGFEPDVGGSSDGFPEWLDRCVGQGMSYAESRRASEVLRVLWSDHLSQALRRAAGGLERLSQAEVLFTFMREYEDGTNEAWLLVEGKETSEGFLRSLRQRGEARSTSYRPKQSKQQPNEHSDTLQPLPRFLARDGEAYWAGSGWENAVPRVANGVPSRVDRLRALGNAVVPQIAEIIGRAIMSAERDEYDADDDITKSIDEAYRVIRERMRNGGPGWTQKEYRPK